MLGAVLGVDGRAIEQIVSERENKALLSLEDVSAVAGVPLAGGITSTTGLPSRNLQLTISVHDRLAGRAGYEYQKRLLMAPRDGDNPLVYRPASRMRRVPLENAPQGWVEFPDLPDRGSRLRSRLRQSP